MAVDEHGRPVTAPALRARSEGRSDPLADLIDTTRAARAFRRRTLGRMFFRIREAVARASAAIDVASLNVGQPACARGMRLMEDARSVGRPFIARTSSRRRAATRAGARRPCAGRT